MTIFATCKHWVCLTTSVSELIQSAGIPKLDVSVDMVRKSLVSTGTIPGPWSGSPWSGMGLGSAWASAPQILCF